MGMERQPNGAWSGRDRDRLRIVAETFVAGDAERRADLAIAAVETALEPSQVRQLRLALRMLDSRALNAVLAGRPAGLADLSTAERERLLRRWAESPLGLMRSGFQAWKRLLVFLAYAVPSDGTGTANPRWQRIDYRPDRAPLADTPTPIAPLDVPADLHGRWELEADVAIVGSGAGGGVMAAELARAGRSVLVLEAGPFVPEPEMPADEFTAFDRMYLDHGLCATRDGSVAILAGATVGGGTTVNWTTTIAIPDHVRREWARAHGLDGVDGAEADADLAVLEHELGVAPPATMPPKDAAILRGSEALGYEAAPTRRDAETCSPCGSCGFGCRQGTKRSGMRAHLAEAARCGARVVADARVSRVLIKGGRATGVEGTATATNGTVVPFVVRARQVVVAAGALRTPVVLTRSGIASPAVGRYLRLHPVAAVAARFDQPVESWRGPLQAARSLQFLRSGGNGRGFIIESAPAHPGLMALAFPWQSAAEHAAEMDESRFAAPLIAICRDRGSGTVRPARGDRARIEYRVASGDQATLRQGLVELARVARAAGARRITALGTSAASIDLTATSARDFDAFVGRLSRFDFAPNRGMVFSAHQMGSARMGGRATDHVCDPAGHVRADASGRLVAGLYVADASLFPTAIGVNPMLTVMMLARRVSRTVLAES